jgi:DNA-binding NarL/FixJ family response regulator
MAMNSVAILVVDDHELIRRGIRDIIQTHDGWQIVGEADNGRDAVQMAASTCPDIVVMDISMPGLNGLDATRQIVRARPETQVLVLSMHDSERLIRDVLSSGARGYILKSDAGRDLLMATESLLAGKPFFTPKVSEVVLGAYLRRAEAQREPGSAEAALTTREREILQLLAEGKSNKEIGTALDISTRTVETHRRNLMSKLNLHSIADVVRYALKCQLAS